MSKYIDNKWSRFIRELPHQKLPYSKKNWGHPNHSLCSYQGKLKPAIAYFLVKTFVPKGGSFLDPFCGVGTIPFEGALNGKSAFGMDISPVAFYVSSAKVQKCDMTKCESIINELQNYILDHHVSDAYYERNKVFGFNKTISEYYHPDTFKEILAARQFFCHNVPKSPEDMMVLSSLLHILHGNRPYALSRNSHPIVPYAPSGPFVYKNLIEKLTQKVTKSVECGLPKQFTSGHIFLRDSTEPWPEEIDELDAIITSPPFYDSTRFYLANWIRLWFTGWDQAAFQVEPGRYIDERQKESFDIYHRIFEQARERLKPGGYFVMHLGKSEKCDMGEVLRKEALYWFPNSKVYCESVTHCSTFGIKDIGDVTSHEYLIMKG
jgi:SAM-dependent methyltransferase